jgi:hypothetical protein
MFSRPIRSLQLVAVAGLALAMLALGACNGGGGGGTGLFPNPNSNNNPQVPQSANASIALSQSGVNASLPSVGGFTESIAFPANNAASGTTLSLTISTNAPKAMPALAPDMFVAQPFLYLTLSTNKNVTLNNYPGFTFKLPAGIKPDSFPVKIGYYDPKVGWKHVGDFVYSNGTATFKPSGTAPIALVSGVTYYAITYTCGGPSPSPSPSPSPTPTGVLSCTASGTGAVAVLCISRHTYAFAGTGRGGGSTVVQLDISGGASTSTAPPTHTYSTTYNPTKCNGDEKHFVVFCAGDGSSAEMTDVNASAQTSVDFNSGASGSLGFSGGSCTVCAIAYDTIDNAFIVEEANPGGTGCPAQCGQFVRMNEAAPHAITSTITTGDPNENPGYDYVKNWVFNPGYSTGTLQVLDFGSGKAFTTTSAVANIFTPDSAAVDVATHIGETPDECNNFLTTLADLGTATMSGTTLTVATGQQNLTSSAEDSCLDVDATAVDSVLHVVFFSGEFGTLAFGFADMPTVMSGTTFSDWAFAQFPLAPDGTSFASGVDPHQVAAFNDPVNCPDCAIAVNASSTWLAVIDLNALRKAPRSKTDSHAIDPTYDLLKNHVVGYYKI